MCCACAVIVPAPSSATRRRRRIAMHRKILVSSIRSGRLQEATCPLAVQTGTNAMPGNRKPPDPGACFCRCCTGPPARNRSICCSPTQGIDESEVLRGPALKWWGAVGIEPTTSSVKGTLSAELSARKQLAVGLGGGAGNVSTERPRRSAVTAAGLCWGSALRRPPCARRARAGAAAGAAIYNRIGRGSGWESRRRPENYPPRRPETACGCGRLSRPAADSRSE